MRYKTPSKEELNAQLIEAAKAGRVRRVKRLLKHGAELDSRDEYFRKTALMLAAESRELGVVKFLVDNGADVNARDNYGWTAMIMAAYNGRLDVVKFLAELGADLSIENIEGKTAARIARESGQNVVAEYLDSLLELKERNDKIVNSIREDNERLTLKQDIQRILRTGQEYNAAKHGVSYAV